MPRSVAEEDGPPIALRPFRPEPITWLVSLVWRASRRQPPAAKGVPRPRPGAGRAEAEDGAEADVAPDLAEIA